MHDRRPLSVRVAAAVAACGWLLLANAEAQSHGGNRQCTITDTGVDFGNYDTLNATPTDSTGTISYSCSQGGGALNVVITISRGLSGTFSRAMSNGSDRLQYNLYLDAGFTRIWGDGSQGTETLSDKIPGNSHQITAIVYGRVFPRQNVGTGVFVDRLTVTMVF